MMHTLYSETREGMWSVRQGQVLLHQVVSPMQAVSALFLVLRSYPRTKAHFKRLSWGEGLSQDLDMANIPSSRGMEGNTAER